jgi:hypothetical protein
VLRLLQRPWQQALDLLREKGPRLTMMSKVSFSHYQANKKTLFVLKKRKDMSELAGSHENGQLE